MVVIGIFIEKATPFMDEFWQKFVSLGYPKDKIHLFIHNKVTELNDILIKAQSIIEIYDSFRPLITRCKSIASLRNREKIISVSN